MAMCCGSFSYASIIPTDGSNADVIAKLAGAVAGDTVTVPSSGSPFHFTTAITIPPGVHLQGAGCGGIVARSLTSMAIGTGTKVFTVAVDPWQTFTAGQGVTVHAIHNGEAFQMIGTVTSLVGDQLTLNITSTVNTGAGGSTWACWVFRVDAPTTIIDDATSSGTFLVQISPSSATDTEVNGIYFKSGTGVGTLMEITESTGLARVHDCQFSTSGLRSFSLRTNHALLYNDSFDAFLYAGNGGGPNTANNAGGIVAHPDAWTPTSWNTPSTMGAADTTGKNNVYIEDCRFTGIFNQAMDFDGNSRVVFRHNILDNSALTSHGQDTSPSGLRHMEVYGNIFYLDSIGVAGLYTYPSSYLIFIRGGTGVITENEIPDAASTQWSDLHEVWMTVFNVRLSIPANLSCQTTYPASRQIGYGYIDGSGPSMSAPVGTGNLNIANAFMGDLEPFYIWGNTGNGSVAPNFSDATDTCGNGLTTAGFLAENRDYYIGVAKPGYTKYTYPHPLRAGSPGIGHTSVSGAGNSHNSGAGTTTIAQ